jgi:hypothetical protein
MGVGDWFARGGEKVLELVKEINQLSVKIEAIDKETHRMLEDYKRRLERAEEHNRDLERRLTRLEANVDVNHKQAVQITAAEAMKQAVREHLATSGKNPDAIQVQVVDPKALPSSE